MSMSDNAQHGAARLQSSAMVVAAFITTLGAITAACIQTGLIVRPPAGSLMHSEQAANFARQDLPVAQASFLGTIEPYHEATSQNWGVAPAMSMPSNSSEVATTITASSARTPQLLDAPTAKPVSQPWPSDGASSATLRQSTVKPNVLHQSAYQPNVQVARLNTPQPPGVMQTAILKISPEADLASISTAPLSAAPFSSVPTTGVNDSGSVAANLGPIAPAPSMASPVAAAPIGASQTKQTADYAPATQVAIAPASASQATLLADDGAVKILPSPWLVLAKPTSATQSATPKAKKSFDWGTVARFFHGEN